MLSAVATSFSEYLGESLQSIFGTSDGFTFFSRLLFPILACVIVYRCVRSLLGEKSEPELWGYLYIKGIGKLPVQHWENTIGRSKSCDIVVDFPTVSRTHATLMREDDGKWYVTNLDSRGGVKVSGKEIKKRTRLANGATVSFGGINAEFVTISRIEARRQRTPVNSSLRPLNTVLLLTFFQLMTAVQLMITTDDWQSVAICFGALIVLTWGYYLLMKSIMRTGIELELLALFLSTLGMAVSAVASPAELYKQLVALLAGFGLFAGLGWYLRDLHRATSIRLYMYIAAAVLLLANLIFGTVTSGARNWIYIGSLSIQPSELVKVAFVFVGGATLDRLLTKQNLIYFIAFSGFCIVILCLLGDFGTASIFFVAFLVIAYMRSGDLATLSLICAAVAFGAALVFKFMPYILRRFAVWGHVWEDAHAQGFQQTRTMSAAASGGLFGTGPGNGWLSSIVAADTDLVFGVLCEEWGLIIALLAVASIAALAVFTVKNAGCARSSYYTITSCAAMSILVFQTILNVLGSVDILPLTGVTFPLVSNGGSSLISCWGLLAFVKASDTRRFASFANSDPNRFRVRITEEAR